MKKKLFVFLLTTTFSYLLPAQNTTNAPTSMFGIGEIFTGDGGTYSGMGGVSIALQGETFLNASNPASLTGISGRNVLFDIGLMAGYESFKQNGATNNSLVGNLNNVGLGFKVLPRWYTAISLSPVSSVGYAVTLEEEVQGSNSSITSLFEGEGGLSRIGISNGITITPRLSLGINLSYISGKVNQTETQSTAYQTLKSRKYVFYSDFGLQYKIPIDKFEKFVVLGAVYGPSQKLKQENDLYVYSSSSGEYLTKNSTKNRQYMPQYWGVGASYNSLKRVFTAEYKFIDWSESQSGYATIDYKNQHIIRLGATHALGNPYKNPFKVMLGVGYYNSYISIRGENAQNYYVSTGLGVTLRNNNMLSFGVKYKDQFNKPSALPHEQKLSFYLNLSFVERVYRGRIQ